MIQNSMDSKAARTHKQPQNTPGWLALSTEY